MTISEQISNAKKLLALGKTLEATTVLEEVLWNSPNVNNLIVIKNSFLEVEKLRKLETANPEYIQRSSSRVVKQLLELIEDIDLKEISVTSQNQLSKIDELGLGRISANLLEKVRKIYDGDAEIIGNSNAFVIYVDGLNNVRQRFLTTTYIDSDFWINEDEDIEIEGVNRKLVERIGNADGSIEKGVHRLFLIPAEIHGYISNQVDSAISRYKDDDPRDLNALRLIIERLRSMSERIKMKVISINSLPRPIRSNNQNFFNPKKYHMEIALYDNFRVDIFQLDRNKRINSTRVISRYFKNFETMAERICKYYREAWNSIDCYSIEYYLDVLTEELNYQTLSKVDYDARWLIKYDHLIRSNNYILNSEKSSLLGYLEKSERHFNNHLDVGVCTGRYPEELKKKSLVTRSYSVDLDSDVAEWMEKFQKGLPFLRWDIRLPSVVAELNSNFHVKKFDLITCMVSTISHFNKKAIFKKFDDNTGLFSGVKNMGYLLNENGLLVISTWSDFELLRSKELDLYSDRSIDYLEFHTPVIDEIMSILNSKENRYEFVKQLDNDNFNIYIITKRS
ncbi:MAG: hypothetical protein DHS20C18_31900 [Saprospiraceae bacterium]|nr:MAG: hypothetical protein DHS20C18_31900 [Saprospiraceae bacterium]